MLTGKVPLCAVLLDGQSMAARDTPSEHLAAPAAFEANHVHTLTYFDLFEPERRAPSIILDQLRTDILETDRTVAGFNIGMNSGEAAGQTVNHAHVHLIPRRQGDVANPRGGIRGIIPGKKL
jgi:diadenosine tetraphosphate (Ap4A) HIT family hydrolase